MPSEAQKLVEQAATDAPKEFRRVKRMRNLVGLGLLAIFVLTGILSNYFNQSGSECVLVALTLFTVAVLMIWLREIWKCPVCYETPGWILTDPQFCSECGTKLEE